MTKRIFDIIIAICVLLLLSFILIILAWQVKKKLGAPILFRQIRPGLNETPFHLVKFRTMVHAIGTDGKLLPDDQRLSSFGKWLRSTSLDELPEFWNVLKGEMSLVGPRPLLMEYLPLYNNEQRRRHQVMPGVIKSAVSAYFS